MKKRSFLAPLAASIAALLGSGAAEKAIAAPAIPNVVESTASRAAVTPLKTEFVLTSNSGVLPNANHESHYSHESHLSHVPHSSHLSHYSSS